MNMGGGVVFYVDGTGQHGLIAATEDIRTTYSDAWRRKPYTGAYRWSTGQYDTENTTDFAFQQLYTRTGLWQGAANTRKILAKYPPYMNMNSAASVANAYSGGGYSDWFLPGKDELNQLYLNKLAVGGFADGCYWSSSELDIYRAWTKHFGNGYQGSEYKVNYGRVRAVRSF